MRFPAALRLVPLAFAAILCAGPAPADEIQPQTWITIFGDPKFKNGFDHYPYVNPDAPKGGELRQAAMGTFDSLNPFIVKGQPAAGAESVFDTLMSRSADEPETDYGLVAQSAEIPPDKSWVIFNLRPEARFHDGSPITADDVVFSFDTLKEKGQPFFRSYYEAVTRAEKLDDHRVRFVFAPGDNHETPSIISELPVLSKNYWAKHKFDETTLDPPLGSGPYRIKSFEVGRTIVLERVPDYWAKDLPVNKGLNNFDTIRVDYYRDTTVELEAFKAGAFDLRIENESKKWATGYDFPARREGHVKLQRFPNQRGQGMQGYAYNLRRPIFQDWRVRRALDYAFDFEWDSKHLFYGEYVRTTSYYSNSELAAPALPTPDELKLLEPLRGQVPDELFTQPHTLPTTDGSGDIRDNLKKAADLLKEAGYEIKDGKQVNSKTGQPLTFEILLEDPAFERITLPFAQNLARLGVTANVRTVDSAQYKNRTDSFDFDMIVDLWGESDSPGNEQREFWGSASADQTGSRNTVGIKSKAVDALIEKLVSAPDREALVTACHALDRVLLWGEYVIPHFHQAQDRVAYWDKFGMPDAIPKDGVQLMAWWVDPAKAAAVKPYLKN